MAATAFLVLAIVALVVGAVAWLRGLGTPTTRWSLGLLALLAFGAAGLMRQAYAEIPGSRLSDDDLAAWRQLAEALGRGAASKTGDVLVVEAHQLDLPELRRLSQARREAFATTCPAARIDWRVVPWAGYWGLTEAEAGILPVPTGQQRLVVLWDLVPPTGWAKKNGVRLVVIGGDDTLPTKPLLASGEALCVVRPAVDGPTTGTAFVLETADPATWKLP